MTRRPIALTLLTLAAATLSLATPAAAGGGGVRLNFGGPLGTFVATPTPGYGGASHAAPRKSAPKPQLAKRTPPAQKKTIAERHKPQLVRRIPDGSPRPQVVAVRHAAPVEPTPSTPITAAQSEERGFLSRTLTVDSLPRSETVRTLLPSDTIVAMDGGEPSTVNAAAPAPVAKAEPNVAAAEEPATCRKFIPAVGVTVTVACD